MKPASPRLFILASLGLLALLGACASATRVTLLPQASGTPSAVEVSTGKCSRLIDQPYRVANVCRRGEFSQDSTSANRVREAYPRLLALQAEAPDRFVPEFEPRTPQLTAESQDQLEAIVAQAKARAGDEIVVTGHTDRQGSLEANGTLSRERAQAVRSLLIDRGFAVKRIEAVDRGEREPVVPTGDEMAEPRNRRADIVVR